MSFTERHVGGVTIIDLAGQLTETAGDEMWGRVRGLAAAGGTHVVLNLASVSYVDSAGLGAMVASFVALKTVGGVMKLLKPTARTRQLLNITTLSRVMDTYESESAAIASFAG
jgi:anti-sigma B factor antagonist